MSEMYTRRELLLALSVAAAPVLPAAASHAIETHVHLFDPARVPYAPNAPYNPPPYTLADHEKLIEAAGLEHSIIVHPEPYQDDHRYLEYCLAHEPRDRYFKATCLFDPLRQDTLPRIRTLAERWPNRIVALRIHAMSMTPENGGPIRNRDMKDPRMRTCWQGLAAMGLAVQMHFIPGQAPNIRRLAAEFSDTAVILDHMGRPGQGSAREYDEVVKLAQLPRVILKYSGWEYYKGDLRSLTKRLYDAFGPDRMIWGTLGNTVSEYRTRSARFEELLSFASDADRIKIRRDNAQRLFFN
jgi:predicted TIM-barrel fold metal-dependent hydrolase